MLLNLRGYGVEIRYNPGCKEVLADTLSQAGTVKLMKNSRRSTWSCLYQRRVPERDQSRLRVTSRPNHGEKWMAKHNAASSFKGQTLLDIP
mgnify:CR=1 FL=1